MDRFGITFEKQQAHGAKAYYAYLNLFENEDRALLNKIRNGKHTCTPAKLAAKRILK